MSEFQMALGGLCFAACTFVVGVVVENQIGLIAKIKNLLGK